MKLKNTYLKVFKAEMIYDVVDERKMDHYMAFEVEVEVDVLVPL